LSGGIDEGIAITLPNKN
jgi:hypothetical protein